MDKDSPGHQISIVNCENVFVGDKITVVLKVPGTQGMSKSCVKIMTQNCKRTDHSGPSEAIHDWGVENPY